MRMPDKSGQTKKTLFARFHVVEVGGNALPHPASLFGLLALAVLLLSDWPLFFMAGHTPRYSGNGKHH